MREARLEAVRTFAIREASSSPPGCRDRPAARLGGWGGAVSSRMSLPEGIFRTWPDTDSADYFILHNAATSGTAYWL